MMSSVTQAEAVVIAGKERSGIANSTYYIGIDLGMSLGPMLGGLFYGSLPITWFYPLFIIAMPVAWIIYLSTARFVARRRMTRNTPSNNCSNHRAECGILGMI